MVLLMVCILDVAGMLLAGVACVVTTCELIYVIRAWRTPRIPPAKARFK